MSFQEKILAPDRLPAWRAALRRAGKQLVVTNGCFDILHAGHVTYLDAARKLGDALLVGLNSDASVSRLKGPGRPVNPAADRAVVLAALQSVDAVCVFEETSAAAFLAASQPDLYVKGGNYTLDNLDSTERNVVEQAGGKIVILPLLPGRSTSGVLEKLAGR